MDSGEARKLHEVADRLAGNVIVHPVITRYQWSLHAAHVLGHEIQHLADEDAIGLGVAKGARQQDGRGLAQCATDDAGGAAQGALG